MSIRQKHEDADKRLKRKFSDVWNTLLDDVVVQKLMVKIGSDTRTMKHGCGTQFQECGMRVPQTKTGSTPLCLVNDAITLKAYILMQRKGYSFIPIGCLKYRVALAEKTKDTKFSHGEKKNIRRFLRDARKEKDL